MPQSKRAQCRSRVVALFDEPTGLESLLVAESALPGRRANLELAAALADVAAERGADDQRWAMLTGWAGLCAVDAPTNHPREFLPFCAVQAIGALHAGETATRRRAIVELLQAAAVDVRWRTREAAAFGLQRIGEASYAALQQVCDCWLAGDSPLLLRAVLAALAHAPLLAAHTHARYALQVAADVLTRFRALDASVKKSPAGEALRKALGFAPSVFVAALPAEGFSQLERWASLEELEVKKIVAANLRKARLARHFPDEVEAVGEVLMS